MDNSQTHYLTYDPDEIWHKAIEAYVASGGDVLYPGDAKEMLLRAVQSVIIQVFAGADAALCQASLKNAVRGYLDLYAERQKLGCVRLPATKARCTIEITYDGISRTIPAGTTLTADGQMIYALDYDIKLSGSQRISSEISCTQSGEAGNGLTYGTQLMFMTPIDGIKSVYSVTNAAGGQDEENDDAYRERIRTFGITSVTTGPASMYEAAAKAVSPDIIDAKAIRTSAGVVGIYLLCQDPERADALKSDVKSALSDKNKRPLTDLIEVESASEINYTIRAEYAYEPGNDISAAAGSVVDAYLKWQNMVMGRAFNPDRLKSQLYEAGATRVNLSGSGTNGGALEYTEIENNEYLRVSVELAVMGS